MVASCLLSPSLILQASVYSRGTKYPPHVSFVTTPQGGNVPRTYLLHEESVTQKIMTSSVKAKIWKWLTAVAVAKTGFQFQFHFQFQGFQFQFHFQFLQFQFQFQFQFRNWNWNWPAIPIPELNWPQPWCYCCIVMSCPWLLRICLKRGFGNHWKQPIYEFNWIVISIELIKTANRMAKIITLSVCK